MRTATILGVGILVLVLLQLITIQHTMVQNRYQDKLQEAEQSMRSLNGAFEEFRNR